MPKTQGFSQFEAKNSQFTCQNIDLRADQHRIIFAVLNNYGGKLKREYE
jgi:hypothetical protein